MATTPEANVWLDELPDDVNLRITRFLRVVEYTGIMRADGLNLALVSEKQTGIVLSAMGNNFSLCNLRRLNSETAEPWCITVSSYLRYFDLTHAENEDDRKFCDILLKSPNLEGLTLLPAPETLKSITHIPSLRSLCFIRSPNMYSTQPSLANHVPLLFETLSKLHLTDLNLDCLFFVPSDDEDDEECGNVDEFDLFDACGFRTLLRHDPDPGALGKCCPNIRSLRIRCRHTIEWEPLPAFLDGFKNLREFTPDFTPEDIIESQVISSALIERMRKYDSVHLSLIDFLVSAAANIGAPVKTLRCSMWKYHKMYEPQEMELLSSCPNIEILDLYIKPGVEKTFPNVALNFKSLRTLGIEWDVERDFRGMKDVAKAYHCPSRQLLQAIEELPALSSLSLLYVTLPIDDVKSLLKRMGSRLQNLTVCNRSQEEPQVERLTLLMEELSMSNPELLSLRFEDDDDVLKDRRRRKQRPYKRWGSAPFRIMEPRMQRAFRMLRRNAQFLDWKRVVRSALFYYKLKLIPSIGEEYLNFNRPIPDC